MLYAPQALDFSSGWENWRVVMNENQELLNKIDQEAKDKGELLWRYIQEPVADGYAVYQIVRVNKKSVRIVHCTGLGDDYFVNYWGEEATIDLDYAEMMVSHRDHMAELFSQQGA